MSATIIRIKQSTGSAAPANDQLQTGELAYSFGVAPSTGSDKLFIGYPQDNGSIVARPIGGKFFTDLLDHTPGQLTSESAVIVDSNNKVDQFNVDDLRLDSNVISSTSTDSDIVISPNGAGTINVDSSRITNVSTPSNGSDAANKSYVDAKTFTLSDGTTTDNASLDETILFSGGNGIITTVSDNQVTISEDFIGGNGITKSITSGSVTFSLDTGVVTAGQYGNQSTVPQISVDSTGRVTNINEVAIQSQFGISANSGNDTDTIDVDQAETLSFQGGTGIETTIPSSNTVNFSLANTGVTSGTYGNATNIPSFTVNNQGQITNVTENSVATTLEYTDGSNTDTIDLLTENLEFTGGTGVTTLAGANSVEISIGQDVGTTSDVTFNKVSLNGNITSSNQAVTKSYVDSVAQGVSVLPAAFVATISDLSATFSVSNNTLTSTTNGAIVIDGTSLSLDDNVLVKNQASAYENGSYVVTQVGDASNPWVLTRCTFCDETVEIPGSFEFVINGNTNESTGYVATVPSDFEINNTSASSDPEFTTRGDIVWEQFSGVGTFTAGTGLSLDGTEFNNEGVLTVDGNNGNVTSAQLMSAIQKEDGSESNLDADLLDGNEGTHYLDYNNFTNTPTIGNALITIAAGAGLSAGGNFTTNQTGNETITLNHADTSSQASVDNSGVVVVQDVTLDTYGHVTGLGSQDLNSLSTIVYGDGNTASGSSSSAVGYFNDATGSNSSAFGHGNDASGGSSSAFGKVNTASANSSSAFGYRVNVATINVQEFGKWGSFSNRQGAIRIHDTGMAAITIENNATAYSASAATDGAEANGELADGMFAFRRDGADVYLDGNFGGTIETKSIGILPNDSLITISAGTGLSNGGNFTTDQSTNETITINADIATTTSIGVASFSSDNFSVTAGGEVSVTEIDGGTF